MSRSAHLVPNYQAPLAGTLNFGYFNHGAEAVLDIPHDILVDLKRVLGCFFEENGVRNSTYIRLAICTT
jgi:hypothetical protein